MESLYTSGAFVSYTFSWNLSTGDVNDTTITNRSFYITWSMGTATGTTTFSSWTAGTYGVKLLELSHESCLNISQKLITCLVFVLLYAI